MKYYVKDECYRCKTITTFYIYTGTGTPYAKCSKCGRRREDHINFLLQSAQPCDEPSNIEWEYTRI